VRNREDGVSVELAAQGSRDALEELLAYLHRGPLDARVESVIPTWRDVGQEFADFRIVD
jgi:acylphosphatase